MAQKKTSWSDKRTIRLRRPEVWDLMWRRRGQARWLGPQACIDFRAFERSVLADEAGYWRTARVVKKSRSSLTLQVDPKPGWPSAAPTLVRILLTTDANADTVVTIEESGCAPETIPEIGRFWIARLDRLCEIAARVRARRRAVRQAVVVIHGIGEQQPGETLTSLVKSQVLSTGDGWVKPDRLSDSYELRSVTLAGTADRPTTDVFELYWAHVIRDTSVGHITSWLERLLLRWPVPAPLRPWWLVAWGVLLLTIGVIIASFFGVKIPKIVAPGSVLLVLIAALWRFKAKSFATDFLGDAARYLRPNPANIAHRQAIRQAGVTLLEKLQTSGRYDRIVLLGHSLGSVIAYDIVTYAWTRVHGTHRRPSRPRFKEILAVEQALRSEAGISEIQELQHAAWRRLRANTQPWLVTDLVTIGSPLTYSEFLIASNAGAFGEAKTNRILPTCPPQTEKERKTGHRRMTFDTSYREPLGHRNRAFVQFDHAAAFAVTRWTNLYFKTKRLGLTGDIIGGPVAGQLGKWIRDVPLESPRRGFTHSCYWLKLDGPRGAAHLPALHEALKPDSRQELASLLAEIPAFALLEEEESARG